MTHWDKYGVAHRDEDAARQWRFNCWTLGLLFGGLAAACLLRWVLG